MSNCQKNLCFVKPCSIIKSIVNIALQSLEEKDYDLLEKDLNTIDRQIDRLTRLIQDIMELTKIDNLESNLEKVDLKTPFVFP